MEDEGSLGFEWVYNEGLIGSQSHKVTKSQSHKVTKSQSHRVTKSQSHKVTESQSHRVTKSQSHKVTESQSKLRITNYELRFCSLKTSSESARVTDGVSSAKCQVVSSVKPWLARDSLEKGRL